MSFLPADRNTALLVPTTAPHYEQGLLGLANATRVLLRHSDLSAAFPRALEHLRVSIQVERLYVCRHHGKTFELQFEALSQSSGSRQGHRHWKAPSYRRLGLDRWPKAFLEHRSIGGLRQQFSETEKQVLELEEDRFAWLTPIHLADGELWGFLGCEHCMPPMHFGSCEQPLLLSLASNFGYAVDRQHHEQQMQHQAFHDLLTGLPNRMLFNERLPQAIAHARRTQEAVAVIFLDFDKFKQINDRLGHDCGDELLVQATERLKQCLREEDILARWGGDEFTLCLPNLQSSNDVIKVCQRLLAELRRPFQIQQETLSISGSIGISLYPQDGQEASLLLRQADEALYRVKKSGRDHYQFFQYEMNSLAIEQLAWSEDMRQALKDARSSQLSRRSPQSQIAQELEIYYQPLVRLSEPSHPIYALEALLRWHHPTQGLLATAAFLPHAEQAKLMLDLGHWIMEAVSGQIEDWRRMGLTLDFVSVNLSEQQFHSSAWMSRAVQIAQTRVPGAIAFELDEGTVYADLAYARSALANLKTNDIRVILQQMDKGRLEVEALTQLPVHRFKLSRTLLSGLDGIETEQIVDQQLPKRQALAAHLAFAQSLSLPVIAQGVESEVQLELLRSLGCGEAQGNWLSLPMNAAKMTQLLQTQHRSQT